MEFSSLVIFVFAGLALNLHSVLTECRRHDSRPERIRTHRPTPNVDFVTPPASRQDAGGVTHQNLSKPAGASRANWWPLS